MNDYLAGSIHVSSHYMLCFNALMTFAKIEVNKRQKDDTVVFYFLGEGGDLFLFWIFPIFQERQCCWLNHNYLIKPIHTHSMNQYQTAISTTISPPFAKENLLKMRLGIYAHGKCFFFFFFCFFCFAGLQQSNWDILDFQTVLQGTRSLSDCNKNNWCLLTWYWSSAARW